MHGVKQTYVVRSREPVIKAWEFPTLARTQHHPPQGAAGGGDAPATPGLDEPEERLRHLEARLRVAERANRALLTEVARTQADLRATARRSEAAAREARERAHQLMEGALRAGGDRTEQQQLAMARIATLEAELAAMARSRVEQDRVTDWLAHEVSALRHNEQAQRTGAAAAAAAAPDSNIEPESTATAAAAAESRELRRCLYDIKSRIKREAVERGRLERRVAELASTPAGGGKQPPGDAARTPDADMLVLQTRIQEAVELLGQRMLAKEVRLREEAARGQAESERMLMTELESRLGRERVTRQEMEQRLMEAIRGAARLQPVTAPQPPLPPPPSQPSDAERDLAEAARCSQEAAERAERRLQMAEAEATERRRAHESEITGRLRDADARIERTSAEVEALTQKLRNLPGSDSQQLQTLLEDYRQETARRVADTEERVQSLHNRLDRLAENVDANALTEKHKRESIEAAVRELGEKIDSTGRWQDIAKTQITTLQSKQTAADDLLNSTTALVGQTRQELTSKMSAEIAERVKALEEVKKELDRLHSLVGSGGGGGGGVSAAELDECQALVRKLAEAVQTVKTVLGMKIQSEQTLRVEELKGLQESYDELKTQVDELMKKQPTAAQKGKGKSSGKKA